jgi:hypothetical protein
MNTSISYFDTLSEKELKEYTIGQKEVTLYFDNEEADLEDDWKLTETEYRSEYEMDYYCCDYEPSFFTLFR